jgi:hypothetical protein
MPSLYEIDQAIMNCCDAETGEIIDPEALDTLLMQRDDKLEAVACWIKNLQSDAQAYKAEKDAFAARQRAAEKKLESLKRYLSDALQGQKFSTAKCAVSFRKSVTVEVEDVKFVPAEWVRVQTSVEPDKTAIKEAIKAGHEISGCKLVENLNIQIK